MRLLVICVGSCYRYNSSVSGNTVQQPISLIVSNTSSSTTSCNDQALIEWLQSLQIDEMSIEKVNITICIDLFILTNKKLYRLI